MRMMVFDRRICRWRPWHGTRAAWLKLPHAVATGTCVLSAAALVALHTPPHVVPTPHPTTTSSAPRPAVASPTPADWLPATAFVPSNPFRPTAVPAFSGTDAFPTSIPTSILTSNPTPTPDGGTPPAGPVLLSSNPDSPSPDSPTGSTTQVPEPGSFVLLAGALWLLAIARRVSLPGLGRSKP